jgi:hypothetical protein
MLRWLKDFRLQLAVVVLGAWGIRLWAVSGWSRHLEPAGDQNFYWRQGQDLAEGFGFVYRNNFGERVPTAIHPPLHSAYLGVVSFLGGTTPYAHRLACTFMGALAVCLVGLAGRRIAGNRVGIIAAVFAAVYPNLWFNDALLLSESTFAATIAAVILASYRFRDRSSLGNAALLGVAIGLATLTRAEGLLLFVLLAAPLVLWRGRRATRDTGLDEAEDLDAADALAVQLGQKAGGRFGRRVRQLAVVWVVGGLVIAPWVLRNLTTFENRATVSTGAGFVLEISNCDQTYGLAPPIDENGQPRPGTDAETFLGYWSVECDRTPWPAGDETVVEAAKRRTGVEYMRDHPDEVPRVVVARTGRIWDLWRPAQSVDFNVFFEGRNAQADFDVLGFELDFFWQSAAMRQYFLMLALSVAGAVILFIRRVTIIPFVAIAISATLAAAVSFGITRYRVGADVGLCLLAAVPLDAAWRALRRRMKPAAPSPSPTADGVPDPDASEDDGPAGDGPADGVAGDGPGGDGPGTTAVGVGP